jgi:hypothetical protein
MTETNEKKTVQVENTYHWPADGESRPWTEFWITTLTTPVGQTQGAGLLFSLDDGETWKHQDMQLSCVLGENDVWHVSLGMLPAGTRIRYAVEAIDAQGTSIWDNRGGQDYRTVIGSHLDQKTLA